MVESQDSRPPERRPENPSASLLLLATLGAVAVVGLLSIVLGEETTLATGRAGTVAYGPGDVGPDVELLVTLDVDRAGVDGDDSQHFAVRRPPFSDGVFPCTECHDPEDEPNRDRRALEDMHEDIELRHGSEDRWCFDCHAADNRDQLRLANGQKIGFDESFRLCGQCHGTIYRDWRAGIHGRRIGRWNGAKQYLLCAHCHNPHQPRFAAIAPLPPPVRPDYLARQERR